jgi:hypothetical protein
LHGNKYQSEKCCHTTHNHRDFLALSFALKHAANILNLRILGCIPNAVDAEILDEIHGFLSSRLPGSQQQRSA